MTQQSEDATEDARVWRGEIRSLTSGVNLGVLILAIAAGIWGVFDGMADAAGERIAGNFVFVAPSVYAGWCMLEPALRRGVSTGSVMQRLVTACFFAPGLVAVPVAVVQAIAMIFPGVRQMIADAAADNGGFHYFWDEGLPTQLMLMPFAAWALGMSAALGAALILTLPILSLRAPQVVAAGSHIEKVDGATRDSTSAFVFCGLGATMLGIVLWSFGDGGSITEFPEDFARFMRWLGQGSFVWDQAIWLLGVVFVAIGVAAMAWGCVRVLFARSRARDA